MVGALRRNRHWIGTAWPQHQCEASFAGQPSSPQEQANCSKRAKAKGFHVCHIGINSGASIMKRILILSALALSLGIAGATANPLVAHACPIYTCPINGG
jgi:hypothetical protein